MFKKRIVIEGTPEDQQGDAVAGLPECAHGADLSELCPEQVEALETARQALSRTCCGLVLFSSCLDELRPPMA